jgi:hypothetical protein
MPGAVQLVAHRWNSVSFRRARRWTYRRRAMKFAVGLPPGLLAGAADGLVVQPPFVLGDVEQCEQLVEVAVLDVALGALHERDLGHLAAEDPRHLGLRVPRLRAETPELVGEPPSPNGRTRCSDRVARRARGRWADGAGVEPGPRVPPGVGAGLAALPIRPYISLKGVAPRQWVTLRVLTPHSAIFPMNSARCAVPMWTFMASSEAHCSTR